MNVNTLLTKNESNIINTTLRIQYSREYLDFLFTEMVIVFESFWLLPAALSCLKVIIVVVPVLEAMFHPHTISAA